MALTSPGVQVSVIDESYYVPAQTGTTPLIVVATAQNKTNASGTGTAQGTLKANAGKAYRIGSQRELVDTFGVPTFKRTVTGSPIHGSEQNEYGLQAAYSFLGVSNTAYVVRADIDLDELSAKEIAPGSEATDGQWWLDTASSLFGVFEWDGSPARVGGQKFNNKIPKVLTSADVTKLSGDAPASGFGVEGDYAVVAKTDVIRLFYKGKDPETSTVSWELVGTAGWRRFFPAYEATLDRVGTLSSGNKTFTINGTTVTIDNAMDTDTVVGTINGLNIFGVIAANKNGLVALYTTGDTDGSGAEDSTKTNSITIADGNFSTATIFGTGPGTYYGPELVLSPHTQVPQWKTGVTAPDYTRPTGSLWVKTTDANLGAHWRTKRWNTNTKAWVDYSAKMYPTASAALYSLDRSGGGSKIAKDTLYIQYNYSEDSGYDATPQTATFRIYTRKAVGTTTVTTPVLTVGQVSSGTYTFSIKESLSTQNHLGYAFDITVTLLGNTVADWNTIAEAINNKASSNKDTGLLNIEATYANNRLSITHKLGGDFRLADPDGLLADLGFSAFSAGTGTSNLYTAPAGDTGFDFVASNWEPLQEVGYIAEATAPLNEPVDGQRWFSSRVDEVDIMVHNGTTWVGYQTAFPATDPKGPIVAATRPTVTSEGTTPVTGDLWVDTSDLENYPVIYRFNADAPGASVAARWILIDKTDETSEDGILFADARWGLTGADAEAASIVDLRASDYVDGDAPDPDLYPRNIILWNTRRSGFNIKRYVANYVDLTGTNTRYNDESQETYETARWVTDSGVKFGRKAQRQAVVTKLQALIDTNTDIRETEVRDFDLIACPGYTEVIDNLINLNLDRGTTAFVLGDSPMRLTADNTSLSNWGLNANQSNDNDDNGLVSHDEYAAVFYPSGYTNDNTGNAIVVPASHMMLKTIALSDQVSYPWFAPAGTRRGGITNATSVGYINAKTQEFVNVSLTESQRDTLYSVAVNPLTYFNGIGLVNYGQKTRAKTASALDRINVARLVVYLRKQLNALAKPYVFEPNDKLTRDEVKQAVESLLLELVGLRAIYDYVVVCDETNNTPSRIDRNELYVDIAIEPVKAIEFIYIPLRLKNTGEIKGASTK